ncbi:hypothetical protein C8Q78DRAFT_1076034 [Trametes maxima]|nr:hypothetical protein C8Q78DRAFT_1076034 [Trametes maxima]
MPRGRAQMPHEDSNGDVYETSGPGKPDENFYNALFKTLEATKSSKWSINNPSSPAGQLSKLARLIPRQWGPFLNMGTVVTVGMSWYDGPPARWVDKDEATLSERQRERLRRDKHYVKVFEWLQEQLPFLQDIVPMMVGRSHDTFLLGGFLDAHSRQARATDLGSLKTHLADYVEPTKVVNALGEEQEITPPNNSQRKDKHWYGFHSLWTARLLVPRVMRDEFDEDPQVFCDSIINGRQNMGLCRGPLLLKALRHIFTSPSSVNKPPGKKSQGRGCIAQMYKLDAVHPENIAYTVTLTRSLLSASTCWEDEDGAFEAETFYSNVVRLFKDDPNVDEDWAAETLSWWNS